jgi:alpha-ribazole phosphatase
VIWLVRHAQPLVEAGVCYGALDLAADVSGTQGAAMALAAALPQGALVKTSPLQRCERLAQVLYGLRPDLLYKVDERLREMNFGQWEGVRWADIPSEAITAWSDNFWAHRFGGAESVADVMARVAGVWDEAAQTDQAQVWITHAGVIRAANLLARGVRKINDASLWPVNAPGYGEWVSLG